MFCSVCLTLAMLKLILYFSAENICIKFNRDDSCTAKLIDFGSSKTQKDRMTFRGLTPEYLPPSINSFLHDVYLFQKKQVFLLAA